MTTSPSFSFLKYISMFLRKFQKKRLNETDFHTLT